jgi:hypothetical protein
MKARPGKEVVLRMPNEIGTLSRISKTLADKGINIVAVSAWVEGADVVIRLLTDEPARTADALRAQKHAVREVEVVVTEVAHKPGMLRSITERLAQAEIDIHHLYASAPTSHDTCLVVFATANNDHAIVRLNAGR